MTGPAGRLSAAVRGFGAFALAQLLDDVMPDYVVRAQRQIERGRLDPAYLAEVTQAWADVRLAGDDWARRERSSAVPTSSADPAELAAGSTEIDTKTAGEWLGCSDRYVRRLVAEGVLAGERVSRRGHAVWQVDADSVRAFRSGDGQVRRAGADSQGNLRV